MGMMTPLRNPGERHLVIDMSKHSTTEKRIRLTLDLTPKQFDKLKDLEDETGASKMEIVRNAIRLYAFVAERALAGDSFRAVDKNGKSAEVVLVELT
jgi:hypothetical protein